MRTYVYTYTKGKAKKIETIPSGHTAYYAYPGKGVVLQWAHQGSACVSVLTMKSNKLKNQSYGYHDLTGRTSYCLIRNTELYSHVKYDKKYNRTLDLKDLK